MSTSNGNARFLDLDAQAERLVAELTALRDSTISYATAERDLSAADASVRILATGVSEVAAKIGACAEALREIGTPQILAEQAAVTSELRAVRAELERLVVSMDALVTGIDRRLSESGSTLDVVRGNLVTVAQQVTASTSETSSDVRALSDQGKRHQDALIASADANRDRVITDILAKVGEASANTDTKIDVSATHVVTAIDAVRVSVSSLGTRVRTAVIGLIIADVVLAALIIAF